jgi:hypothetical protein
METNNQSLNQAPQGSGGKESEKNSAGGKKEKMLGEEIENPAEESEIGPNIYDLGMGGPDASSSGVRTREDDEREE